MGPLEKELGRICFPFTFFAKFLSLESKTLKFTNSHQKPSKYQILQNVNKKCLNVRQKLGTRNVRMFECSEQVV